MYINVDLTPQEQKVLSLYSIEGLTFGKIAEMLGISRSRASQIYHKALGKQDFMRRQEFYAEQNQKDISLTLKLGEIVVLQRILNEYLKFKMQSIHHTKSNGDWEALQKDVDFKTARILEKRIKIEEKMWRKKIK